MAFVTPFPNIFCTRFVGKCSLTLPRPFALPGNRFTTMSITSVQLNPTLHVHIVPILSDNFSYVLQDTENNTAALVDPAEPKKVLAVTDKLGVTVTTSLTTHHHWDHAGGNEELVTLIPGVEIIGSAYETAPAVTKKLNTGDKHQIRQSSIVVRAVRTPCHTNGHLCFALNAGQKKAVFTGDTLFVAGCGRFFEGDARDMHTSLNEILSTLDDDTLVFCGHEYTISNLKFAQSIEPSSEAIKKKLDWAVSQRQQGLPTVPTSILDEKLTNPFMRNSVQCVKDSVGMSDADAVAVMKELRERKNRF